MNSKRFLPVLLGASMLGGFAAPALAQDPGATTTTNPITPSPAPTPAPVADTAAVDQPVDPNDAAQQVEFLKAQVDAMQAQLDALKKQVVTAQPSWKGAPQWTDKDSGFSFKPKGYAQFDGGYVSDPGDAPNRALGFNARARRLVIGAQGTLPGGFGYNAEFNFAQGSVDYEDLVLTYAQPNKPFQATIGYFYPLSSLETMTSSRVTSFVERAIFTQGFNYTRRLGAAVAYVDPADHYSLTAGFWTRPINNSTFTANQWQASLRGTFSPSFAGGRLHIGASFQHRQSSNDTNSVTYATVGPTTTTNVNFLSTGAIAEKSDNAYGVELAGIFGPFDVVGELQRVDVNGYRSAAGLPAGSTGTALPGATAFYAGNPKFTGGYAEAGFFFTGESRAYKGGKFDRVKVLHPFDQGGIGAIQLNGRFEYLDLNDRVGGGGTLASPDYVNGGKQMSYLASLIWNPIDYVRFIAQYSRSHIKGGPQTDALINPTPFGPLGDSYNLNAFTMRAQVEF